MQSYVLDTNLFFNMEAGISLGDKTEQVVRTVTESIQNQKNTAEFFMPPRVVEELLSFFEDKEQGFLKDFISAITVKSPQVSRITFPAEVFYSLVEDIRNRSYRGMQVAEEEIGKAGKTMIDQKSLSTKDFQMRIGSVVRTFRDRYRRATRFGFIDSLADMDLIALAQEQEAFLVSTDEGVIKWARMFGVREMRADVWGRKMEKSLTEVCKSEKCKEL